jgi:hypothetical protein
MSTTTWSERSIVSACPITSWFTAINPMTFSLRQQLGLEPCSVEVSAALRSDRFGEPTSSGLFRPRIGQRGCIGRVETNAA